MLWAHLERRYVIVMVTKLIELMQQKDLVLWNNIENFALSLSGLELCLV